MRGSSEEVLKQISKNSTTPGCWRDIKGEEIRGWVNGTDKSLISKLSDAFVKALFTEEHANY